MAKLFIGIALVVMLATAALGFLTKGRIDQIKTSYESAKARITTAEAQAKTAKNEADKAVKEAKDAGDKLEAANKELAQKAKDAEDAKRAADEGKVMIDKLMAQIDDLNKKVAGAAPGANPEDVAKLKQQIDDITSQLTKVTMERDEAKQNAESLVARTSEAEKKYSELKKLEDARVKKGGLSGLRGHILAVNSGWNFVVLSVGDKQGVSVNAPLLVVRGNEPIARARITSVEPGISIADVLPGTVPKGVSVQPGDTVIFQGRTSATNMDEAKPAPSAIVPSATLPAPAQPPLP